MDKYSATKKDIFNLLFKIPEDKFKFTEKDFFKLFNTIPDEYKNQEGHLEPIHFGKFLKLSFNDQQFRIDRLIEKNDFYYVSIISYI